MRGIHEVVVQNNRVQYKFAIRRNLTILRGDSATGKSTLIDLIAQYVRDGENSGVVLRCDKPCIVLTSDLWDIYWSCISKIWYGTKGWGYKNRIRNRKYAYNH